MLNVRSNCWLQYQQSSQEVLILISVLSIFSLPSLKIQRIFNLRPITSFSPSFSSLSVSSWIHFPLLSSWDSAPSLAPLSCLLAGEGRLLLSLLLFIPIDFFWLLASAAPCLRHMKQNRKLGNSDQFLTGLLYFYLWESYMVFRCT